MSGKKSFQKWIREAGKFRKLEVEVLLMRYVETFEYEISVKSKAEVNFSELSNLLHAIYNLTQVPLSSSSLQISEKEIGLIFRLWMCLIEDSRPQLHVSQSFCELILINCNAFTSLLSENLQGKKMTYIVHLMAPTSDILELIKKIVDILINDKFLNPGIQSECLSFITRARTSENLYSSQTLIDPESTLRILNWMVDTLQNTEIVQPTESAFLGDPIFNTGSEKKASKLVCELDGSSCRDQFTVLNTSKYFSQTQQLHFGIFSNIKPWLESCVTQNNADSVKGKLLNYISRVLDQCELNLRNSAYRELIYCTILEISDLILIGCGEQFVPQFYHRCSSLFQLCQKGDLPPVVSVKLCQFLVQHADSMGKSPQPFLSLVFGELLSQKYSNSDFCSEVITFLFNEMRDMTTLDSPSLSVVRYFPNIFKILAWNPRAYLSHFLQLLSTFLNATNRIELFYYILDLPCVAAVMELCRKLNTNFQSSSGRQAQMRQIWENQVNQVYIGFLMRKEAGKLGDTLSKMEVIHLSLKTFSSEMRVMYCSDASSQLLSEYFTLLFQMNISEESWSDYVPIILERSNLLYGEMNNKLKISTIFANVLLEVLNKHPTLVYSHFDEIHDYISSSNNIFINQSIYLAALVSVNNSAFLALEKSEWTEKLARLYESLECLTYELLDSSNQGEFTNQTSGDSLSTVFWSLFITCLGKISSVAQDLIPRCSLVLSKIQQNVCVETVVQSKHREDLKGSGSTFNENLQCLSNRINELGQLLSQSNLGPSIMCNTISLNGSLNQTTDEDNSLLLKTIDTLSELIKSQTIENS